MDPTECLRDLLAAMYSNDRDTAEDCLAHLAAWIRKGGALPTIHLLGPVECREADPDRIRVAV